MRTSVDRRAPLHTYLEQAAEEPCRDDANSGLRGDASTFPERTRVTRAAGEGEGEGAIQRAAGALPPSARAIVVAMRARDTSPEAAALQLEAYRRMGPAARLRIAFQLSDFTHKLALTGIRERQPELGEAEAYAKLAELLYLRKTRP